MSFDALRFRPKRVPSGAAAGPETLWEGWRARWRIAAARYLTPPSDVDGYRRTWKRFFNLYLNRYEVLRRKTVLRSRPTRLVIEPTNVCNLRCPYCHTGAGRFGRRPSMMPLAPYFKLLEEIGDYLILIEVFNWGEAMLHAELPAIIARASALGIATRVNSNLSFPFSAEDAERLVESGLTDLFVAIDGPTQEVYERYRVGGDLAQVIRNCRLIDETKRRLGRDAPRLTLQFLEFPFNVDEGDAMRHLAAELGMSFLPWRGAVPDPAWGERFGWPQWFLSHSPGPCPFLWGQPVLTVDGNIAPCRGVFQGFDDITHLATGENEEGSRSFAEAWNHERYRAARALFRGRNGTAEERRLPCYHCPTTVYWERWREHRARGGSLRSYDPRMVVNANGSWNYFWARGQKSSPSAAVPENAISRDAAPDPLGACDRTFPVPRPALR